VRKAIHRATGLLYAIKIVNRSSLYKNTELALRGEISILRDLRHEHVMALYDSFATIDKYYLITEYLEGGELFDRIVDKSAYAESEARDVCAVLFGALDHINSRGIAHRDLKPENLLLASRTSDTDIKIADFGFAKFAHDDNSLRTMCGTPGYVAPEILRKGGYGTKCDLWSMGVIVFIIIGGYPPFYASTPRKIFQLTLAGRFTFDPEYWDGISQSCKDMICALLELDPARRASANEILSHP
jgi:serine/threonine protein kinase